MADPIMINGASYTPPPGASDPLSGQTQPASQGIVPPPGVTQNKIDPSKIYSGPGTVNAYNIAPPPSGTQPPPVTPPPSTGTGTGTDYNGQINDLTKQSNDAYTQFSSQMQQFQNGTFPLTPDQQAQLAGLQAMYQQQIKAQQTANENYQGGVTQLGINTGQSRYAPDLALGAIQQATSDGITKVTAIQQKMADALATMREGFQDKDFKMVQTAYDEYNSHIKDITKTIQDTRDQAQKAIVDAQNANHQNIQDQISRDHLTLEQANAVIDHAQKQQQIDETKAKDLRDYAQNQQKINLQKQANDLISGAMNNNPIKTLPSGAPDPVAQANYLATLPPMVQPLIKGLADYKVDPTTFAQRLTQGGTGLTRQQGIALVLKYDPSYNEALYPARSKYIADFTSGKINTQRTNVNTAINHLGELKQASDDLMSLTTGGFFGAKHYNNIATMIADNSGNPKVTAYLNVANKVAAEVAQAYGETTGGERNAQQVLADINNAPAQKDAVVQSTLNLLSGLTTSMTQDYQSNMGKLPEQNQIIFPSSQNTLKDLNSKGIDVNLDKFAPSAYSGTSNADFLSSFGSQTQNVSTDQFFGQLLNNAQNAGSY